MTDLAAYQDDRYAAEFREMVGRVRAREQEAAGDDRLAREVARSLHKLMSYKDEYEVARLSLAATLQEEIAREFGPGASYSYRVHPPFLRALGLKRKISLGPWIRPLFRLLVAARRLRGTPFDPFGRAKVRVVERALITEYRAAVERLLDGLSPANHEIGCRDRAPPRSGARLRAGQVGQRGQLPDPVGRAPHPIRRRRGGKVVISVARV